MTETPWALLLSCEHGGNRIPAEWQGLFAGREQVLETHRGYDLGIAPFARWLSAELPAPLQLAETSRLLVELNRSPGHPRLFSEFTRGLTRTQRDGLLAQYYHPYRQAVQQQIADALQGPGRVCHVSLHSFTPQLDGEVRNADIGLLYDPQRSLEAGFCRAWQALINRRSTSFRVRCNYPYRGIMDSFVVALRRQFPPQRYLGLELEINQRWPIAGGEGWRELQLLLRDSLRETLGQCRATNP